MPADPVLAHAVELRGMILTQGFDAMSITLGKATRHVTRDTCRIVRLGADIATRQGGRMSWTKAGPIGPVRTGCLCCPPKAETAPLDWDPDPGFGIVYLTRNGENVMDYMRHDGEEDGDATCMTVQDFEDRAAGDPDHDWRFEIHGPLGGIVYQRHGEAIWVAVERLDGFA